MAASPCGRRASHLSLPTLLLTISSCITEAEAHRVLLGYQICQHLHERSEFHLTPLVGNLPSWRAACVTCLCPAAVQLFPTALRDKTINMKCGDTEPKLPDAFQFQKTKHVVLTPGVFQTMTHWPLPMVPRYGLDWAQTFWSHCKLITCFQLPPLLVFKPL